MNESGNQKANLSYLASTKKRSDFLLENSPPISGARAEETRALFLSNTAEERVIDDSCTLYDALRSVIEYRHEQYGGIRKTRVRNRNRRHDSLAALVLASLNSCRPHTGLR